MEKGKPKHYKYTKSDESCLSVALIAPPNQGKTYFLANLLK